MTVDKILRDPSTIFVKEHNNEYILMKLGKRERQGRGRRVILLVQYINEIFQHSLGQKVNIHSQFFNCILTFQVQKNTNQKWFKK